MSSLRSHAARLRSDLGRDEVEAVLVTEGDGYRLNVGAGDLDSAAFEQLAGEAARMSDPEAAISRYDQALALWRNEAYVEFGDAPFAAAERVRLAELRAFARERRTDLALATRRAVELVGELEERVRAEPFRERGWAQLALALYRDDRQAEALGACRRARQVLVDDLGVDPGPDLRELESRLLRQDPDLLVVAPHRAVPDTMLGRCPYLGLAGYAEQDAAVFVGRERLTALLASRLCDQSVVVVTGASGVGKSSLVRAGLIPALRAGALPGSSSWRIDLRTPASCIGWGEETRRRPDLLVFDQAEELFTGLDPGVREDAVAALARYVEDSDGRLMLVLRSDFYPRLAEVEPLAAFAQKTAVLVGPLRADELRRALVEPAAAVGLRLEADLVETVMENVAGQTEPLPLLSEAMVRTWHRREGDLLTLEAYRLAGELSGALEAAAEECFTALGDPQRRAARHLLVRMAARTATGWVRAPITAISSEAADAAEQQALSALITARLVVVSEQRIEIAHDALLAHWPRLREWLDERALAADLLRHLDQAATTWRTAGRQDTDLYRGPRLTAALDWRAEHPADLSPSEQEFLDASRRAADAELEAARAQTRREARGRRRLRSVAVVLALVVVLAAAAALVAAQERTSARHSAARAQQAALAADARRLAALSANAADIATSSLLAVAADRLQDSPDSRGALLTAVERNQSALWRIQFQHRPLRLAATPGGSRLAVNDNREQITIIDPRTRKRVTAFPADGQVEGITADGREVVVFGPTNSANPVGRLSVYDVASGHVAHVLTDAGDLNTAEPVTTPDGRWVAAITTGRVGSGSTVDVFDAHDWVTPPRQFVTSGQAVGIAASRSAVAVQHGDGSVEVRALPSLRLLGTLAAMRGPAAGPFALAVSPDGSGVARVDPAEPRQALLSRLRAGAVSDTPLPLQPQGISIMAFAPDGSELALGSFSGSLAVYLTDNGAQVESLAGHAGPLTGAAWSGAAGPTGLYTVGLDSQLVSWDLATGPRTVRESGPDHLAPARAARFGALVIGDAQPPATPNSHRELFTGDLRTGTTASWSAGLHDDEGVTQIVASADGRRGIVSIVGITGKNAGRNRLEIWDLSTHRNIGHLALPPGTGFFVDGLVAAISPDGRYAYSSLGLDRIGVFGLPSGRYLRSLTLRFADPDSGRIEVTPWQFDPAGRLVLAGFDSGPTGAPWSKSGPPLPPDQRLGLLDVSSGRLFAQARLGDISAPSALAWSHDGGTIAVGTYDGTLALYDASTLTQRTDAGAVSPGYITTAAFAPDDKTLVIGGTDGAASLFSVPDLAPEGEPIAVGNGANNGGTYAWYSPGGDIVGYAQDERRSNTSLQRWFNFQATPRELAITACALAGSDMTPAQWQRYVGDRPYRHVCPALR